MIIGKDYLFISVPKTGSSSVRAVIEGGIYSNQHHPYWLIKERHDVERLYKFGFVRNPWDRFVSFCAATAIKFNASNGSVLSFQDDPQRFMRVMLDKGVPLQAWAQAEFLTEKDGTIAMDYIGRYETLQQSFDEVCDHQGWIRTLLPHYRRSDRDDFRSYYNSSLVDRVAELYKRDIELFGYTFE